MKPHDSPKSIYKVATFALPISLNMLVNMIASFIAMIMVAKLGKTELAAAALAIATFIPIITTAVCIFYALGILISHQNSQQRTHNDTIGPLVRNGFWLAALLSIPVGTLLWNADKILLIFNQDPILVHRTHLYFHFAAFLVIPNLFGSVIIQFFSGIGRTKFSLKISLLSLPFIVLTSYGLILGNFGLPHFGLAGVTLASCIIQSSACLCVIIYIYFATHLQQYKIFSGSWIPNRIILQKILFLGLPIGIQFGAELFALMLSTYMMGYFGIIALASIQIVSQFVTLGIMIILGLAQGLSLLVSSAYAEKNTQLINQYIYSAMVLLTSFFTIIFLIFYFAPEILIRVFTNKSFILTSDFISLTSQLFIVSGLFLLVDGFRNIFSGTLRGLHDSKTPMALGILCLWCISLPMSYLIGFTLHGGPVGLRFGFLTGFIIAAILLWYKIRKKVKFVSQPLLQNENVLT